MPTVRNNGKPYRTRHHREWDRQVRKITGGLTILAPAKGQWISPSGELYLERMIPVRIACNEAQMAEVVKTTLNHYPDQQAIMHYEVSNLVQITERK